METLVCTAPGSLKYLESRKPELKHDHAIIKVKRIGITNADIMALKGVYPRMQYPRVLGSALSGELVAFDNAPDFQIKEKVTVLPYLSCERCKACLTGNTNCCLNLKTLGLDIDGAMAEYLMVPSRNLFHGSTLTLEELATITPIAVGAHSINRACIMPNEFVLVIGTGVLGLSAITFAHKRGANVISIVSKGDEVKDIYAKLDENISINILSEDSFMELKDLTAGSMAAVVIDTTADIKLMHAAFSFLSHGGRYVLAGLQNSPLCIDYPDFFIKEATLITSRNATSSDFDFAIESVKKKIISPRNLISKRIKFSELGTSTSDLIGKETSSYTMALLDELY